MDNFKEIFQSLGLVCPECKSELFLTQNPIHGMLSCSACKKDWPIEQGIPDFRSDKKKYWGEYEEDKMVDLISDCQKKGWSQALKDFFWEKDPRYYDYILDEKRANWHFLLSLSKEARILDLGCGWGTLSFALAKKYQEVFAFDTTRQRLEFIQMRRQSENIENLFPLCGQINYLPFRDNSFDLVVLNGVLEWVPSIEIDKKPYAAQKEALKEACRVLKENGYLYLAIENRWSVMNFLGFRDAHSKMRFVPLLPRYLANICSRMLRKKDFREYTYTYWQYKEILKQAGFNKHNFYMPLTSYRSIYYMVPAENEIRVRFFLTQLAFARNGLQRFFIRLAVVFRLYKLVKYFVPDFSIFAQKLDRPGESQDRSKYILLNNKYRVTLFDFKRGCFFPEWVIKIYDASKKEHIKQLIDILERIYVCDSGVLKRSVPKILGFKKQENSCLVYEEYAKGIHMMKYAQPGGLLWKKNFIANLRLATLWIADFHRYFQPGRIINVPLEKINILKNKVQLFIKLDFLNIPSEDIKFPTVVSHQDFRVENILRQNNKIVVFDWDKLCEEGLPLFGLLGFILSYFHARYSFQQAGVYLKPEVLLNYFNLFYRQKNSFSVYVRKEIDYYTKTLGLSQTQKDALLLLWLYAMLYTEPVDKLFAFFSST